MFRGHCTFPVPSVLIPSLDLSIGQVQFSRQLHPVLDGEILLPLEGGLEGPQLVVGERGSSLPLLLRIRRGRVVRSG